MVTKMQLQGESERRQQLRFTRLQPVVSGAPYLGLSIRTAQNKFPNLFKRFQQLADRARGESLAPHVPQLNIGGECYYLGIYRIVPRENSGLREQVSGYALANEWGKWVNDESLFARGLLTYYMSSSGSMAGRETVGRLHKAITRKLRLAVPASEYVLGWSEKYFADRGGLRNWTAVMERISQVRAAGHEATRFIDSMHAYVRQLGTRYSYADAIQAQRTRDAFVKYMLAAHYQPLDAIRAHSTRAQAELVHMRGPRSWITALSLRQVSSLANMLILLAQSLLIDGALTEADRAAFRKKMEHALRSDIPPAL